MSTVFQKGDIVRIHKLPSNYGGTIEELQSLINLELPIHEVRDGGKVYVLALKEQRVISGINVQYLPVEHGWVEAQCTIEEIK